MCGPSTSVWNHGTTSKAAMLSAEQTYSAIFSAPRVQVRLRARPRLAMNSADDVKKLFECGVFTQRDVFQLRTMFLQQ